MSNKSTNPFFPGMEMPDFSNVSNPVLQGLDMMSKAWANMGNITGAMPNVSLTPEELDKRIAELRTVENWLRINQTMLQSTIQGLEVQRATIATLNSFAQGTNGQASGQASNTDPQAAVGAWWDMLSKQFTQMTNATAQSMANTAQADQSNTKKTTSRKSTTRGTKKST